MSILSFKLFQPLLLLDLVTSATLFYHVSALKLQANDITLIHDDGRSETVQIGSDSPNMVDEVNDPTNMVDSEVHDRTNMVDDALERTNMVDVSPVSWLRRRLAMIRDRPSAIDTETLHEDDYRPEIIDSEVNDRTNMVNEVNDRTNMVDSEVNDRTNMVEEGHDRTNMVEDVHDRTNMVEEFHDRTNMVDEVNDRTNMVEEVHDHTNMVDEVNDRTNMVDEVNDRTNMVDSEVHDCTNMVEEVHDRTNMVEEVHDRTNMVEEVHDHTNMVDEVNVRTNMVDEVNDRINMVEEVHDHTNMVDEVREIPSTFDTETVHNQPKIAATTATTETHQDQPKIADTIATTETHHDQLKIADTIHITETHHDQPKIADTTATTETHHDQPQIADTTPTTETHHDQPIIADTTTTNETHHDQPKIADTTATTETHHDQPKIADTTPITETHHDQPIIADTTDTTETHHDQPKIADTTATTETHHDQPKIANTNVTLTTENHHDQPDIIADNHHATVNENPVTLPGLLTIHTTLDILNGLLQVPNHPVSRAREDVDIANDNITKADRADSEVRDLTPTALDDDLNEFFDTPVTIADANLVKGVETVTPQKKFLSDLAIYISNKNNPALCGSGGGPEIDDIDDETQIGLTDNNVELRINDVTDPGSDDIEVIDLNNDDTESDPDSNELNELQRQQIQKLEQFLVGGVGSIIVSDVVLNLPEFIKHCALAASYSEGLADVTSHTLLPIVIGTAGYEMVNNKKLNRNNLLKTLKNPAIIGVIGGLMVSSNRILGGSPGPDFGPCVNVGLESMTNTTNSTSLTCVPLPVDQFSCCKMAYQQYFHQFEFTVLQSLTQVLVQHEKIPLVAGAAMPFIVAYTGSHLSRDLYQLVKKLNQKLKQLTESEESSRTESSNSQSSESTDSSNSNSDSTPGSSKSTSYPLLSPKNLIRSTETLTSSVVSSACAMYSVNANIAGQISAVAASLGLQNYILNDQLMKIGTPIVVGYVSYKASKDLIKILGKGMRFVRRKLVDSGKNNTRTSDADEGLGMGKQDGDGGVGMGKR